MNYWIEHFQELTQFLWLVVGSLYFYHTVQNVFSYKITKVPGAIFNIGMCFGSALYCFFFFIGSYFEVPTFKDVFIPILYVTAAGSLICYFHLLKHYFAHEFKILNYVNKVLLTIIVIFLVDSIFFLLIDKSLLLEPIIGQFTSYYGEINHLTHKLNSLGELIFVISTLSTFPISIYLVYWITKNHPKEKFLILGLWISIIATVHDTLFATGKIYYSTTFMYLAYAFESIRFTRHYQREAFERAGKLENELSKVAKVAHIGQIAGSIFHDIRNPLTVLKVQTEHLTNLENKKAEVDTSLKKSLGMMGRNIKIIEDIISSYMGIIHHQKDRKPEQQNLYAIVEDAIEFTKAKAEVVGVVVENLVPKDTEIPCFLSDMTLVITNLITNSCDAIAGSENQKWIKVSFDNGQIFVRDSGKGIPVEIVNKIFEMQFTTKDEGKGTGLGLGIVREVLHKMDHEITVDQEDENTSFVIKIPNSKS